MKRFLYKLFLKNKIKALKTKYFFVFIYRRIIGSAYFSKEFLISFTNFFKHLNKRYKFVFVSFMFVFLFSSIFVLKAHSQVLGGSTSQTYASGLPPTAVQDELTQFFQFGNSLIQGGVGSNGKEQAGMLNVVTNLDAYIYDNNPVSLVKYGQYYAQSHNLVKGAYAQSVTTGTGYNTLAPIIPLWELFRNIAYLIIAVMIVIIGFIIILGGKYGQTEVSIASSLPNIAFAIILITFSYPIAGFVVDLSNVGTNLIVNVLGPQFVQQGAFFPGQYPVECQESSNAPPINAGDNSTINNLPQCTYNQQVSQNTAPDFNLFHLMSPIINYQDWNANASGQDAVTQLIQQPTNIGFLDILLNGFTLLSNPTEFAVDFIMNVLILYWAIRIFILILSSFVRIVTTAMFGPLMLVGYPLKGFDSFLGWFKNLIAPALVFPAVFGMLFIAAILAYGTNCTNATDVSQPCVRQTKYDFGPWYISNDNNIDNFNSGPLLVEDTLKPEFVWNFVALGLVVAIPAVGKLIDDALKNEVSRHIQQEAQTATQRAGRIAQNIPFVGNLLGRVL